MIRLYYYAPALLLLVGAMYAAAPFDWVCATLTLGVFYFKGHIHQKALGRVAEGVRAQLRRDVDAILDEVEAGEDHPRPGQG